MGLKGQFAQQQSRAAHVGSGSFSAFASHRRAVARLLFLREQTSTDHLAMSRTGHKATWLRLIVKSKITYAPSMSPQVASQGGEHNL